MSILTTSFFAFFLGATFDFSLIFILFSSWWKILSIDLWQPLSISPSYSICIYFRIWKHFLYKSLLNPHHYKLLHVRRLKVLHIAMCSKFPKSKMDHARIEFRNMSSKGNFGSLAPSLWLKTLSILWNNLPNCENHL